MTNKLAAIHQQPNDLVLAITPPTTQVAMTVLKQTTQHYGDWICNFVIIGESHCVNIAHPARPGIQEILACVEVPADACQHTYAFPNLDMHDYRADGYDTSIRFGLHPAWKRPNTSFPHLIYDFPQLYGQTPRTAIFWHCHANKLTWWTLHTYINVDSITHVHTKSHFNFTQFGRS